MQYYTICSTYRVLFSAQVVKTPGGIYNGSNSPNTTLMDAIWLKHGETKRSDHRSKSQVADLLAYRYIHGDFSSYVN
jgi:hypothetical protein